MSDGSFSETNEKICGWAKERRKLLSHLSSIFPSVHISFTPSGFSFKYLVRSAIKSKFMSSASVQLKSCINFPISDSPTKLTIHIQNMFSIFKILTCCQIYSFHHVNRLTHPIKIFLSDEYRISIRQFYKFLSCIQIFNIQHTGMISGTVWVVPLVRPLNFAVIFDFKPLMHDYKIR